MKRVLILLIFGIVNIVAFSQNPLVPGYFADPSIKEIDGKFYIASTTDGYDHGNGEPMIWVSDDLISWEIKPLNINERLFWAPSIVKGKNNKYYMVRQHGIDNTAYLWEGESILGPWKEVTQIGDFDVELFVDPLTKNIYGIGSWRHLLVFDNNVTSPGYMETVLDRKPIKGVLSDWTEGPFIFSRDKKYYLMWSGGSCWLENYNINYAMADSLIGTYKDAPNNPLLATMRESKIYGPGHNSVIEVNGHWIMLCHRQDQYKFPTCSYRFIVAYELFFDTNGWIYKAEPLDNLNFLKLSKSKQINLSLGKKVSTNSFVEGFEASLVTDGRNDSRWKAKEGEDKWISIDLETIADVEKVEVDFEYSDKFYLFKIEYSLNNMDWLLYADYTTRAKKGYVNYITNNKVKARYIKVTMKRCEGSVASLWEVKVLGANKK